MTTSPDEIKADIVATRAELVETADALAAKLDAKAHLAKRVGLRVALAVAGAAIVGVVVQRLRK